MLRTRLVLGLASLLLLLVVVGAYAVWTAHELGDGVTGKVITHARGLVATQRLGERADRMGILLRQVRLSSAMANRQEFDDAQRRFLADLREQSTASATDPKRSALLIAIGDKFDRLVERANSPHSSELRPLEQMKSDETVLFAVGRAIGKLTDYDTAALQSAQVEARAVTKNTTTVFALGVGMTVVLAAFFAWTTSRALLRPIRQLTASATALGEGKLDRDVPVTSRDELGELARTFNIMASKLRAYRDMMTKEAQHAMRTMEATLTTTPDPLFVVTADGKHTARNPAAQTLAAMPEFSGGLPDPIKKHLTEVLGTGEHYLPTDYLCVVTIRDRHYLPRILAIGDHVTDFRGAAVILQDVTKFRLLDDAKSNLVGTVSHELKTPLTSLRLSVYLLLEEQVGELNKTQRELVETARDDADRLLRILNDLLDLAKLEAGMTAPDRAPVAVADLLHEMATEMEPIVTAADQSITVELVPGVAEMVEVDHDRIRHVFINLLANASKHSPEGGVIELYASASGNDAIRFGVRDSGPGIPDEAMPRVFEKFYRVAGQTQKGAGLGLTIAREIVVAHHGTIACANRPSGGCDFHFLLPVKFTAKP